MKKRRRLRLILPAMMAGVIILSILVLAVLRAASRVELVMPYGEQKFGYGTAAQTVINTDASFAAGLCVGENDVGNDRISIHPGEHAALFSLEEGKVLFASGMYERIYPASITKIMTAIIALKYGNMNDTVTVNWQDLELEAGSQVVGLRIGDTVSMIDLMHGLLVHSGNDAAMAIARHVGGSVDNFVGLMNAEAKAIGATGTHFVNPSGLHDDDHYTTVYDIYLMLNEALSYTVFSDAMQISVYDLMLHDQNGEEKHITLDSTDHYLTGEEKAPKNVSVLGGKTGTTIEAGSCLSLVAQNAFGQPYIAIVTGAVDKAALYEDMGNLLSQINTVSS